MPFKGLLVVDEAYVDFSSENSNLSLLVDVPNLVILQTFSKAWGMAGARLGMAFAGVEIIDTLNKIKPPYNVNTLSQKEAIIALNNASKTNNQIKSIIEERDNLVTQLQELNHVVKNFPFRSKFLIG